MNIRTIIFHIVSGFSVVRNDFCDLLENGNLNFVTCMNSQIQYQQVIKPQLTRGIEGYHVWQTYKVSVLPAREMQPTAPCMQNEIT